MPRNSHRETSALRDHSSRRYAHVRALPGLFDRFDPSGAGPHVEADHLDVALVNLPMDGLTLDMHQVAGPHLDDTVIRGLDVDRSGQQVRDDVVVTVMVPGVLSRRGIERRER